jgi:hypothetical protein
VQNQKTGNRLQGEFPVVGQQPANGLLKTYIAGFDLVLHPFYDLLQFFCLVWF